MFTRVFFFINGCFVCVSEKTFSPLFCFFGIVIPYSDRLRERYLFLSVLEIEKLKLRSWRIRGLERIPLDWRWLCLIVSSHDNPESKFSPASLMWSLLLSGSLCNHELITIQTPCCLLLLFRIKVQHMNLRWHNCSPYSHPKPKLDLQNYFPSWFQTATVFIVIWMFSSKSTKERQFSVVHIHQTIRSI